MASRRRGQNRYIVASSSLAGAHQLGFSVVDIERYLDNAATTRAEDESNMQLDAKLL